MDEINSTFVPLEEGVLLHDYFWVSNLVISYLIDDVLYQIITI